MVLDDDPSFPVPSKMITILHLITGLKVGGAELQLHSLITRSDSQNFRHIVISLTGIGPVGERLRAGGIEVYALEMTGGLSLVTGPLQLLRMLRRRRPDILHCWMYHANLLGLLAGKLARVPHILWGILSGDIDFSLYKPPTVRVLKVCAWLSPLCEYVIFNSESGRKAHETGGYDPSKSVTIVSGFDLQKFQPAPEQRAVLRRELALEPDCFLIGLVARFDPVKDHETFLLAAGMVAQRRSLIHFLLVGGGVPQSSEISRIITAAGLVGKVHVLGRRDDMPQLNAALDIACSSSTSEGFCNTICEALACGVPCVATDVGDSAHIVGDAGFVVPPRNPGEMADALCRLDDLLPSQRLAMGSRGRKRIQDNFSIGKIVKQYEALYLKASPDRDTAGTETRAVDQPASG